MKNSLVVLVIVAMSMPLSGQTPTTKRVILSPKSNLDSQRLGRVRQVLP
jgi:hypothetical protein